MATHVKWDVETGTVSAEPGAVFSGAYGFIIKLHGLSGHGSRPDMAHSVLDCFNAIYNHMNTIRMKYVSPTDILTFSVGLVNCGTARNIVPDELTFGGSIRTFNVDGAAVPFVKQFMEVLKHECELCQCTYEIVHMPDPLFECYNNPVCSEIAKNAVRKYIGEDAVAVAQPWMASESYQAYLKLWPGVITFTGIKNTAAGTGANHHTPEFDVDEKGMIYGVAAAIGYVVDFLNYEKEIPFKKFDGTIKNLVERNL
jgi:amidohydrolase